MICFKSLNARLHGHTVHLLGETAGEACRCEMQAMNAFRPATKGAALQLAKDSVQS